MLVLLKMLLAASLAFGADDASLKEIDQLFASGDFEGTQKRVNELLVKDTDLPAERRAQLYLMKARLELAYGHHGELRLWLGKAKRANPSLALDPVKDPPQLVAVWDDLKRAGGEARPKPEGTGSFAIGMLPLGIGHFDAGRYKDGALFLSLESLAGLAASTSVHGSGAFGALTITGAYGYELLDMLPELARRGESGAGTVRYMLSYFPFGVGQAKNREPLKAVSLAALQSVLLTAGSLAPEAGQRNTSFGLLGLVWAYGVLDAVSNHVDVTLSGDGDEEPPFRFAVIPTKGERGYGAAAQFTLSLD